MFNQSQVSRKTLKSNLVKNFWGKKEYINLSIKFNLDTKDTFWMKVLREKCKNAAKILDVGCCEGTRLIQLCSNGQLSGLDYSENAIKAGQKKYKNIKFFKADAEKMPFCDSYFDLVYTAYTLEHLVDPEKAIDEMIRVTKKKGLIVFIAPNFGSPLIPTPILKELKIVKTLRAIFLELKHFLIPNNLRLNWKQLQPRIDKKFTPDDDAVNQPYLVSLVWVMKAKGLKISYISSGWEDAQVANTLSKIIFAILKTSHILNFYPFKYWGPTIFLVCKK